jgi:hypothetical protein
MAPPNDPKQSESGSSSGSGSGGGFFASIASSLSNFGTAMTRSVNGYPDPCLLLLFFFYSSSCYMLLMDLDLVTNDSSPDVIMF